MDGHLSKSIGEGGFQEGWAEINSTLAPLIYFDSGGFKRVQAPHAPADRGRQRY